MGGGIDVKELVKDKGPRMDTTRFTADAGLNGASTCDTQQIAADYTFTVAPKTFYEELRKLLNKKCQENSSNTPDFILANFLLNSLEAFNAAVRDRELWYGRKTF